MSILELFSILFSSSKQIKAVVLWELNWLADLQLLKCGELSLSLQKRDLTESYSDSYL